MAEHDLIIDSKTIIHEGIIKPDELLTLLDNTVEELGYTVQNVERTEKVLKSGRNIFINKESYKHVKEYADIKLSFEITLDGMKDKVMERHGKKVKLMDGKTEVKINAWVTTDWENRWEKKSTYHFIATLFDKFVWKWLPDKLNPTVSGDLMTVVKSINEYFRQYEY